MSLKITIVFAIVVSFMSVALATPGIATFYTKYFPSNCYGNQSYGVMIAAASDPLWQNGGVCGKMFKVTCTGPLNAFPHPCTGNSVVVKMVDRCPGCTATIDLSKEAFSVITNPVAGRVKIEYQQV